MKKIIIYLLAYFLAVNASYADDLDDGIGLDEAIEDKIQLKPNIDYIRRSAIARARRAQDRGTAAACNGIGNQIFGAGSNLKGATIINLSDNKGTSAVCVTE